MTNGIPINELVGACRQADINSFIRDHGEAFLLFNGARTELKRAARQWQLTEYDDDRRAGQSLEGSMTGVQVFALPDSSLSPWAVNVGRVAENDLVFDHASVSTWHAAFSRDGRGGFGLRDAGSKAGTFVNEVPVGQQPVALSPGDILRFGAVVLTFLLPADLFHLARNLARLVDAGAPARRTLHSSQLFGDLTPGSTGAHPLSPTVPMTIEAVEAVEQGQYTQARELLGKVLALDPTSRSARLWLEVANGREHVAAGDATTAIAAYEAVLAIDANNAEAHRWLPILRARLGR